MLVRAGVHDGTLLLKKLKEEPHDDFFYLELSEVCTSALVRPLARADKDMTISTQGCPPIPATQHSIIS